MHGPMCLLGFVMDLSSISAYRSRLSVVVHILSLGIQLPCVCDVPVAHISVAGIRRALFGVRLIRPQKKKKKKKEGVNDIIILNCLSKFSPSFCLQLESILQPSVLRGNAILCILASLSLLYCIGSKCSCKKKGVGEAIHRQRLEPYTAETFRSL